MNASPNSPIVCLLILGSLMWAAGCDQDPPIAPPLNTWQQELSGGEVHALEAEDGIVLAGTDAGAYKKDLASPWRGWSHVGLNVDSSAVVDFVIWNRDEIQAAINYDSDRNKYPTFFRSHSGGEDWSEVPVDPPAEIGRFPVHHIERGNSTSTTLFTYTYTYLLKSNDRGETWDVIYSDGGFKVFLHVSRIHPEHIWTGGDMPIPVPSLSTSSDGGETWSWLHDNVLLHVEATCLDAILHPSDPDRVMVAVAGIRKTEDGGESWSQAYDQALIRTFARRADNPGVIYGSGNNREGTLFFIVSSDFGEVWEVTTHAGGPTGIRVNEMISVEVDGREILYFATNKGLYSYTLTR